MEQASRLSASFINKRSTRATSLPPFRAARALRIAAAGTAAILTCQSASAASLTVDRTAQGQPAVNEVVLSAEPADVSRGIFEVFPRSYTFEITPAPVAGWHAISASYRNSLGNLQLLPLGTNPGFLLEKNLAGAAGQQSIATVLFGSVVTKPDGSPEYQEEIPVSVAILQETASLTRTSSSNGSTPNSVTITAAPAEEIDGVLYVLQDQYQIAVDAMPGTGWRVFSAWYYDATGNKQTLTFTNTGGVETFTIPKDFTAQFGEKHVITVQFASTAAKPDGSPEYFHEITLTATVVSDISTPPGASPPPLPAPTPANTSGIPDPWLIQYGIDPITANAWDDNDGGTGDGLSLLQEYQLGTDPTKSDTDGDGVQDGSDPHPAVPEPSAPSWFDIEVPDRQRYYDGEIEEKDIDYTKIELRWEHAGNNIKEFLIEKKISSGSWQTLARPGAGARSHNDQGLLANQNYYYRISTVNQRADKQAISPAVSADYEVPFLKAFSARTSSLSRYKSQWSLREFSTNEPAPVVPKYYLVKADTSSVDGSDYTGSSYPSSSSWTGEYSWIQTIIPA